MNEQTGANIILGVTGSIAAYKAPSILRGLMERGHRVRVVMTVAAQQFVHPTTFRALCGHPVITALFPPNSQVELRHVELADWVDALAIAPCTANFIGKAANGLADDILSCAWMACDCPKLIAPAMNDRMWASPPVQTNCETLRLQTGVHFIGPVEGGLASGKQAIGRLAPVSEIVDAIHSVVTG
ncbi:MAG: phosphopantothenoylcysteine decarboxylase [Planctomycetes bacterium]|nr:phosphopantothenoylcysteine decarboxylase [Planctomycetota bacterium]